MKLAEIYQLAVQMGKACDLRGDYVEELLQQNLEGL